MRIKKGIITAAARGKRLFPVADTVQKAMLPVVDTDGMYKPIIQIIAEEAFGSGIEELAVICAPGDGQRYRKAFSSLKSNLIESYQDIEWAGKQAASIDRLINCTTFIEQEHAAGYGHAVSLAKDFVNNEPFLLLLGDYLYISTIAKRCAAQLIEIASQENCAVSAVNPTIEHQIGRYGTLTGKQVQKGLYQIEKIIEKPSLSKAELELLTPGLRVGYYLCYFGMHVLTPAIFELLELQQNDIGAEILLTPALQQLAETDKYLALEINGSRYDLSKRNGLLSAQLALGLAGNAHDETLTVLVESLAEANIRKSKLA